MQYFAIQVHTSREDEFARRVSVPNPDIRIHVLKKRLMLRKMGKTTSCLSCLFPGYVFLEQEDVDISPTAKSLLRHTNGFIRLLPETATPYPLNPDDVAIIRRFASFGKEIGISRVQFDENDRIRVLKGPMMGLEGFIVKVNRRKRRAKIRLDICSTGMLFDLGYETIGEGENS